MKAFVMEIAGVPVEVQPLFESTAVYCGEYLRDAEPVYGVMVTKEDLVREQALLNIEADEEGLKRRKFSDMFLERSVIQRKVAEELLRRGTLLMHGSTVALDGQAYLFTAACGTGKSTHTRLWREVFGDRAVMVNDDKPFLKVNDDGVLAYGTPWTGKHGLGSNICVPLKGICILKRGPENVIRRIDAADAREMLMHQCFGVPECEDMTSELLERLISTVALWEMECTKSSDAARVAAEAMSGG